MPLNTERVQKVKARLVAAYMRVPVRQVRVVDIMSDLFCVPCADGDHYIYATVREMEEPSCNKEVPPCQAR